MNVQDQKFEARIAELQEQLDVANQRIAELAGKLAVHDVFQERFEATMTHQRGRAEAAERKLATAMDALKAHEAYCQSEEHDRERAYNVFAGLKYKALAQIEQPQDTPPTDTDWEYCEHCRSWHAPSLPTRHIPEEIDYREIGREMAENRYANLVHAANRGVRCRETLESLEALCKERGLTVGYGEHGQVTLSEYPKQQRPGEDPPIDACQCPACVTIRAKSRNKQLASTQSRRCEKSRWGSSRGQSRTEHSALRARRHPGIALSVCSRSEGQESRIIGKCAGRKRGSRRWGNLDV